MVAMVTSFPKDGVPPPIHVHPEKELGLDSSLMGSTTHSHGLQSQSYLRGLAKDVAI